MKIMLFDDFIFWFGYLSDVIYYNTECVIFVTVSKVMRRFSPSSGFRIRQSFVLILLVSTLSTLPPTAFYTLFVIIKINKANIMTNSEELKSAIASADIYRGVGTTFLHIHNPLDGENGAHNGSVDNSNPTGAVVPSISLATTFKQSTPGEASAKDNPNSFGLGFEYSRTGMWCARCMCLF
jgi:hypothetical protein